MAFQETIIQIKKIRADAIIGKKKHFNAAERKQKCHHGLGLPIIIINVFTGSVLLKLLTDEAGGIGLKIFTASLAFVAAVLSALQTYFNYSKLVSGHKNIGNCYLALYKKCNLILATIADGILQEKEVLSTLEELSSEIDKINRSGEGYPTNKSDYKKAIDGIKSGEENYTKEDLSCG